MSRRAHWVGVCKKSPRKYPKKSKKIHARYDWTTGRWTMETFGGIYVYFHRVGDKERSRPPEAGGEHFHCAMDPSPGHILCWKNRPVKQWKVGHVRGYFWLFEVILTSGGYLLKITFKTWFFVGRDKKTQWRTAPFHWMGSRHSESLRAWEISDVGPLARNRKSQKNPVILKTF